MFKSAKQKNMPRWQTILYQQTVAIYLVIAFLSTCTFCLGIPCESNNWWNSAQDKCIKCTQCEDQLIVLRPCQLHQDTVCGTIHDLEIDWMLLTQTEPYWKERRKQIETADMEISWDWQSVSLVLAILACLIFFLAAAYISLQHMRQWRRMEQVRIYDVEELSAKLMSRLAEVRNIENGSFLIENPIKDHHAPPVEVHCIKLEQFSGKEPVKTVAQGNLYIENGGSKG